MGVAFSFNSHHMRHCDCIAERSFHRIGHNGARARVRIPRFDMELPVSDTATK